MYCSAYKRRAWLTQTDQTTVLQCLTLLVVKIFPDKWYDVLGGTLTVHKLFPYVNCETLRIPTKFVCLCVGVIGDAEPMDSEDEASDAEMTSLMVTVGADSVSFSEVTEDMVARMSAGEKAEYVRVGQQLYDQFNH